MEALESVTELRDAGGSEFTDDMARGVPFTSTESIKSGNPNSNGTVQDRDCSLDSCSK